MDKDIFAWAWLCIVGLLALIIYFPAFILAFIIAVGLVLTVWAIITIIKR